MRSSSRMTGAVRERGADLLSRQEHTGWSVGDHPAVDAPSRHVGHLRLRMAAMGGIQLLKTVRADDQLKNTPFILMTGSLDDQMSWRRNTLALKRYLLKPFSQDQLKAKLLEVLTDHHLDGRKSSPGVLRPPGR